MKNAPQSQWLSYLMVAMVGGAAGWIARPGDDSHRGDVPARVNSSVEQPMAAGNELLDLFVKGQKAPDSPAKGSFTDRFEKFSKDFPVFPDPAAEFQTLVSELSEDLLSGESAMAPGPGMDRMAKLGLLLGQWMDVDAKAALTFVGKGYGVGGGERIVANLFVNDLAAKYLEKHGLPALMEAIPSGGGLVEILVPAISKDLAKRGSAGELQQMKQKFPAFFEKPQLGQVLGKEWPVERRDQLLTVLKPEIAADVMTGIAARMDGASGGEWILTKLRNGDVSPELRSALVKGNIGQPGRGVDGIPLQHRIDIMRELGTLGDTDEDEIKNRLIRDSLDSLFISFRSDDDSLFGLYHGILTAPEVMEIARGRTPDPGEDRAAYDAQMFRALAEENLPAAMELLDGVPPSEQNRVKAHAARDSSRDISPDDFFMLTESVNGEGDDELQSVLQEAWNNKAGIQLRRFGRFYLDWVKTLPAGANKTRALKSIQQSAYPKLSAEAGGLLKEP